MKSFTVQPRVLFTATALAALIAFPGASESASFNCAKASTEIEKAICDDPNLSGLDEQLAAAYKLALIQAPNKSEVRQEQRAWIKLVRDRCTTGRCLLDAYADRITDFENGNPTPKQANKSATEPRNYRIAPLNQLNAGMLVVACKMGRYPVEELAPIYIKTKARGVLQLDEYRLPAGCGVAKPGERDISGVGIIADMDRTQAYGFTYYHGGRAELIRYLENL